MNLDLLDRYHLVGRFKLIELLERQSPYRDLPDRVDRRFSQALSSLPMKFREPALVLFGSVLYITRQMLDCAWRYLWLTLRERLDVFPRQEQIFFIELDRDLLRDDFYRANSLVGRLQDNLPFRSAYDVIDGLMQVESGGLPYELASLLRQVVRRPYWVLLVDISLSGGSVAAEIRRLRQIGELLLPGNPPIIIALIQVATGDAITTLQDSEQDFISAIEVPESCALNSSSYALADDTLIVDGMRDLCTWFAETHILTTDYRIADLSRTQSDQSIAQFGYGSRGWNVVMSRNTPNNSLPLLWFRPPSDLYRPPFERIDSRIDESWKGRNRWLQRVEAEQGLRDKMQAELNRYGHD